MQGDKGIGYYYKNRYSLTICRFYKNGFVARGIFDEFDMKDLQRLSAAVKLTPNNSNHSHTDSYTFDGKNIHIESVWQTGAFYESGFLLEDKSLVLTYINKKGHRVDRRFIAIDEGDLTIMLPRL